MPHSKYGSITGDPSDSWDWQTGPSALEMIDVAKGVTTWDALYFFVNKDLANEAFELELSGYNDESLLEYNMWPEERREFEVSAFRLRHLLIRLEGALWRKFRTGELIARGYSNFAALDAPRQDIAPERWNDLELDVRRSCARGPGIEITQILVFDPDRETAQAHQSSGTARYSRQALRDWYKKRVDAKVSSGERSSREEDYQEVNTAFAGHVPRRAVEEVRRELAPGHWKRGGRPRRKPRT